MADAETFEMKVLRSATIPLPLIMPHNAIALHSVSTRGGCIQLEKD
jgi:hypothetical protein